MTADIKEQVKEFTKEQLDAVILVLESFDIEWWIEDNRESGLSEAPQDVELMLNFVKTVRKEKGG